MLVGTSCQPFMFLGIVSLNVQPEGIHTGSLKTIKVLMCKAISIGFNQDPKVGLGFDETRAFLVKFGTAGKVPACEGDNVPRRAKTLGAEQDGLCIEDTRTGAWPPFARDATPAASACLLCMPGSRSFSLFLKVHQLFVSHAFLQEVLRSVPGPILYFAEIPWVAFSTGEIASGLIYGEIIFRPREVDGCDTAVYILLFIFQCCLTCRLILSVYLDQTASGRKALFFELAFWCFHGLFKDNTVSFSFSNSLFSGRTKR